MLAKSDELRHNALEARAKLRTKLDEVELYLKATLDRWMEPKRSS